MNTVKLKYLESIVDGKSVRLREKYLFDNYSELHSEIFNFTSSLDLPFIQRIWHWVNDLREYFLCKCGRKTSFNRNWLDGYKISCSAKCAQSNLSTKEKRKNTLFDKYGVDNIAKLDEIKQKQAVTNQLRYGATSSFQNQIVKDKYKKTVLENWGTDHYFKTEDFKVKAKSYYLKKWGVDHQLKVDEIKEKIKNTCVDKYGVETYLNTEHSRSSIKLSNRSTYESEICEWLDDLNIEYEKNSYSIISPYSLDIFIKDHNLAIEFNGLYWHSEFFKEKDYHFKKTDLCRNKSIQLVHVWEDDWISRKAVVKSIIKNYLHKIEKKIPARKCEVKMVENKEVSEFLNTNHLQGYTRFTDAYGLYNNEELVSLMCFGWRSTNGKKEYELIRFCNKLDFNIIGAASKLYSFFVKNNQDIDTITSYSDLAIFNGNLYKTLGFENKGHTNLNYWWVVKGVRMHRFNFNKSKLVKLGYSRHKTEVEIMHELNNWRVFGCGQEKWIWSRK